MGIVSQEVTDGRLTIVMGDGRSATVTKAQIRNHFQGETGTVAERRAATIQWLKDAAIAALGAEQFNPRAWWIDFNNADGGLLGFGTSDDPNAVFDAGGGA